MQDSIQVKGDVILITKDNQGNVSKQLHIPNLVVTGGKGFIASRMASANSNVMSHIAVGIGGNTAAAASQTTLYTELGRANVDISGGTVTGNTVSFSATFADGEVEGNLSEAGIFNASANGTMLCRTTFPNYEKVPGETLTVSWTIKII